MLILVRSSALLYDRAQPNTSARRPSETPFLPFFVPLASFLSFFLSFFLPFFLPFLPPPIHPSFIDDGVSYPHQPTGRPFWPVVDVAVGLGPGHLLERVIVLAHSVG
jgi:hypothetical protein